MTKNLILGIGTAKNTAVKECGKLTLCEHLTERQQAAKVASRRPAKRPKGIKVPTGPIFD